MQVIKPAVGEWHQCLQLALELEEDILSKCYNKNEVTCVTF